MSAPKDGGGFSGAPAVGALGCYKGVMLCNRPPEEPRPGSDPCQPPFKSTISTTTRDPVGLPPAKDARKPEHAVKTRGPSAALRRHCQWIRELQEQVREDQKQVDEDTHEQEKRRQRMQETFKKQRDAIRLIKQGRDAGSIDPFEIEAILRPARDKKPPGKAHKPLWAMTESEKEGFEDEEADGLIQFAEDIDYDKYIGDLEFRQGLHAVTDRAKKLQREQDAFKDSLIHEFDAAEEEERSTSAGESLLEEGPFRVGRRRENGRAERGERPDWDGSTQCGEDEGPDRELRSAAGQVLEANPRLRGVHSKASAQRLVERASQGSGPPSER